LFTLFVISGFAESSRQRVIILADMGNEPDEEQQMVHMLMYANELDIEGLVAVTGKYLRNDPQPELFFKLLGGYEKVLPQLQLHAEGWPETSSLQAVVAEGQFRYGYQTIGKGKSSPGSRLIEKAILREDERPLHIIVNAGSNTLAQCLLDLEEKLSPEAFTAALSRLRVYENGAQDNSGAWIMHRWPGIHWIRSNYQTYAYGGPAFDGEKDNKGRTTELGPYVWQPYPYSGLGQHLWALEHLKGDHGPLLALWPLRQFGRGKVHFLEGGGTIPWLRLIDMGLGDPEHPDWGGWGGRYATSREENIWSKHADVRVDELQNVPFHMYGEATDTWSDQESGQTYEDNLFTPVWRWRKAVYSDFAARADWCILPYAEANHPPTALLKNYPDSGIIHLEARSGSQLSLDASPSHDPDGDDLQFSWWIYPEAGTCDTVSEILLEESGPLLKLEIPKSVPESSVHLILEVNDTAEPHLFTRYRRIIINVTKDS